MRGFVRRKGRVLIEKQAAKPAGWACTLSTSQEHDLAEILRRLALIRIKSQEKDIF